MVAAGSAMGGGDRHLLLNNLLHPLLGGAAGRRDRHQQPYPPKGCLAVMVGQEGERRRRFVVPVAYLNHPRFVRLLKEAEDEYGFEQQGAIAIPCCVAEFLSVQGLINRELFPSALPHAGGGSHLHHHHHLNLAGCFRA